MRGLRIEWVGLFVLAVLCVHSDGVATTASSYLTEDASLVVVESSLSASRKELLPFVSQRRTKQEGSSSFSQDREVYHQVASIAGDHDNETTAMNATASQDAGAKTETARVSRVYHVFKYLVSLAAIGSVLLLLYFYGLAVHDRLDWSRLSMSPNTWEFASYASYARHLLSLSQIALVETPHSMWTVLDGLSWTGFLPYHSSTSAASRLLDTFAVSGIPAFADRVGVKETDVLVCSTTNLAISLCILLTLFFIFAAVTKKRMDHQASLPLDDTQEEQDTRIVSCRKISMQLCGLLVLLWLFSLYPLSVAASYEVSMQIRTTTYAVGSLVLAVIALPVLCIGGLLLISYNVASKNEYELREPFQFILWGCLCADYTYDKRIFMVAPVLLEIASGVIVGSVNAGSIQAAVLIAIHASFLLVALATKPFRSDNIGPWFLVVLSLVKITNLSLALYAFTSHSSLSTYARASVADAVIYLNVLLVLSWLIRHVIMLVQAVRCLRSGQPQRGDVEEQLTPFQCDESESNRAAVGAFSEMSYNK